MFCLATDRAAGTYETARGLYWSEAEAREQSELLERLERDVAAGKLPRPHPAPVSAGARSDDGDYRSDLHVAAMRLPLGPMLNPATRDLLIDHAAGALEWALASLAEKNGGGDTPFEWLFEFGRWLGRLIAFLSTAEIEALLVRRLDAANPRAAAEVMDMVLQGFISVRH